jgi:acetyltransferase-like isoleucine patch superfamily enzyme
MTPSSTIYPDVRLDHPRHVADFVVIGLTPWDTDCSGWQTTIGSQAIIRSHTVIYAGNRIGARLQTGHFALIRELNEIGDDVSIGSHSILEHHVRVGNRVRIHSGAFIPEYSILEDDCWIGPCAVLTNARYPRSADAKRTLRGPHVMAEAKIGANATLLPGVIVGRRALVGAGAVVVSDVAEGMVVVGNPARVIKALADLPAYAAGQLLHEGG